MIDITKASLRDDKRESTLVENKEKAEDPTDLAHSRQLDHRRASGMDVRRSSRDSLHRLKTVIHSSRQSDLNQDGNSRTHRRTSMGAMDNEQFIVGQR